MRLENLILKGELGDGQLIGGKPEFVLGFVRDRNRLSRRTKLRQTEVPNEPMRVVQLAIRSGVRSLHVEMPYATGCRPGDRPRKDIERHRFNRFFWQADLENAYRQVDMTRLAQVLVEVCPALAGQTVEVVSFLEKYCQSLFGGLPTGAHASQDLFNLYVAKLLDAPIGLLCGQRGLTYSRYVDDLTVSGKHTVSRPTRSQLAALISQAGFSINRHKYHLHDLRDRRLLFHGACLEDGGRIFVPPDYVQHISGLLNRGLKGDFSLRSKIAGAMGVFFGICDPDNLTVEEKRIVQNYKQFRWLARKRAI